MERLPDLLIVGVILYLIYYFTLRQWDYDTQAKRDALKAQLKQQGLSNAYHFTGAVKLFLLVFLSGGGYMFYWAYKQWAAVQKGYKNSSGTPLKFGPVWRAIGWPVSFYQLVNIANRTCIYLHKKPTFPAWFWYALWGLSAGAAWYYPAWWQKLLALAVFAAAPARLQLRLNALPNVPVPNRPKPIEILAAVMGLAALSAGVFALQKFL